MINPFSHQVYLKSFLDSFELVHKDDWVDCIYYDLEDCLRAAYELGWENGINSIIREE